MAMPDPTFVTGVGGGLFNVNPSLDFGGGGTLRHTTAATTALSAQQTIIGVYNKRANGQSALWLDNGAQDAGLDMVVYKPTGTSTSTIAVARAQAFRSTRRTSSAAADDVRRLGANAFSDEARSMSIRPTTTDAEADPQRPPEINLVVSKTDGRTIYVPGQPVTYRVTVINSGIPTASGFSLS